MIDVSNVLDVRTLGLNDDAYDDPADPDYVEKQVEEFEGKSYRPLLDHVEPRVFKNKTWPTIKLDFS